MEGNPASTSCSKVSWDWEEGITGASAVQEQWLSQLLLQGCSRLRASSGLESRPTKQPRYVALVSLHQATNENQPEPKGKEALSVTEGLSGVAGVDASCPLFPHGWAA